MVDKKLVKDIRLEIGEMALSGAMYMQASTAVGLFLGYALLGKKLNIDPQDDIHQLSVALNNIDIHKLSYLVHDEATIYKNNGLVTYQTHQELGLVLLANIIERPLVLV